jgi:hypothetical protein
VVAGDLITRDERGVRWLRDRFPDSDVAYVLGKSACQWRRVPLSPSSSGLLAIRTHSPEPTVWWGAPAYLRRKGYGPFSSSTPGAKQISAFPARFTFEL